MEYNSGSNVPVKLKLQHHPPATARAFEFLENFWSNPPLAGPKSCSNAPTLRKITTLLFYPFRSAIMFLKLCRCKHGLLDNTLTCHKILGIFHINTSN